MTVEDAWERLQKCEAITQDIERKSGRIPELLAKKHLAAQIDYAIAKDDRHDPYMKDK